MAIFHRCDMCGNEFAREMCGGVQSGSTSEARIPAVQGGRAFYVSLSSGYDLCFGCILAILESNRAQEGEGNE